MLILCGSGSIPNEETKLIAIARLSIAKCDQNCQ